MSTAFVVGKAESGRTLAAVLKARLGLSWSQARRQVELRQVRVAGQVCADPVRRVRIGQPIEVYLPSPPVGEGLGVRGNKPRRPKQPKGQPRLSSLTPGPSPTKEEGRKKDPHPRPLSRKAGRGEKNTTPPVLHYVDDAIVVVEKPAGLTTHRHAAEAAEFGARGKRFLPTTLADLLPALLPGGGPVRAVHRIDRDTSGLVVFARTPEAEAHLGRQFRAHTIARRYLAITRGRPPEGRIESRLVRDRGDGRRGSGSAEDGQRAITHVRIREDLGLCTLVECRLETGRTHQVRIHLGEAGAPLAGERIYDRPAHGAPAPDPSGAPRLALHAAMLGLTHPTTGEWMEWESPLPDDLEAIVRRLRPVD